MEFPLSRPQTISPHHNHDSCFRLPSSNSKSLLPKVDKFHINREKSRHPFGQILKSCTIQQNLRPKPTLKPKPIETLIDLRDNNEGTSMKKTRSLLCEQIEKLVFCWRYKEALEVFEVLESDRESGAGKTTYDALVNACIRLRSIRGVKKVFSHMLSNGFELDQYMWNRVLSMHVKCGMMVDAGNLFERMPERNLVSWNMMLAGLVDSGDFVEAFRLFFLMWSESLDMNSRTFAMMIRASARLGDVDPGLQLHSCVVKMGVSDDVYVSCALIDMYSKCGSIRDAQFVFDLMPERNTVGWNTIIAGYALNGYSEKALSLYYEMQNSGVKMDHFTFSIVVRICARLGSLEHAKQAHAGAVRHGFALDVVAYTALVDLYSKWGRIEDARNVFDKMSSKNIVSWNALIAGYGNHGRGEEAIELFEQMLDEGLRPNHVTFLAVLYACCYSGLFDQGWKIFYMMGRQFNVEPRAMHYACMIELLGREGRLDEALALIRAAPFEPTLNMWAALLTASRFGKNFELAKFAAEKLYGMEPEKLSNYVVLLNIHNRPGRSKEAASILQTLKRKGFRMARACTWVEVKKQSYAFLSGDKSHAQTKAIYEQLHSLLLEVSKLGYTPQGRDLLSDVDEKEEELLLYHSEKLALAFGILNTPEHTPLQLMQSHRICSDCHTAFKLISKLSGRDIVLRDGSRFHRFRSGSCSCGDYW